MINSNRKLKYSKTDLIREQLKLLHSSRLLQDYSTSNEIIKIADSSKFNPKSNSVMGNKNAKTPEKY